MRVEHPHLDQVLVLRNAKAGSQSSYEILQQLAETMQTVGLGCEILDRPEDLSRRVAESTADGRLRAVVSAGGDGTLQLVAGLCDPATPIAVLPLGTENLAAKYFGYSADPGQLTASICARRLRQVDAGEANGQLFVVMVSCGFDAKVVRLVHEHRRGHIHKWTYALPIFKTFWTYRFPQLSITGFDDDGNGEGDDNGRGQSFADQAAWTFIFNLPRYASGLRLIPDSDPSDGYLDLRSYRGRGRLLGMWHLLSVLVGFHGEWSGARLRRVREVTIAADVATEYQIDGDPGGSLPVSIKVLPRRITLLAPQPPA